MKRQAFLLLPMFCSLGMNLWCLLTSNFNLLDFSNLLFLLLLPFFLYTFPQLSSFLFDCFLLFFLLSSLLAFALSIMQLGLSLFGIFFSLSHPISQTSTWWEKLLFFFSALQLVIGTLLLFLFTFLQITVLLYYVI